VTTVERAPWELFAEMAMVTVPSPLPFDPSVILTQEDCAAADQPQPSGAWTETVNTAPVRSTVLDLGVTE
jgi:hypothetical protein